MLGCGSDRGCRVRGAQTQACRVKVVTTRQQHAIDALQQTFQILRSTHRRDGDWDAAGLEDGVAVTVPKLEIGVLAFDQQAIDGDERSRMQSHAPDPTVCASYGVRAIFHQKAQERRSRRRWQTCTSKAMDDLSDALLLARWAQRDEEAFAALVTRHEGAMLHHARALVGSGAEDAVQDAFLELARRPPQLPAEAELAQPYLSSWLHKVVRSRCMDTVRSETRRRDREAQVAAGERIEGEQGAVDRRDTHEAVRRAMETLPQDQREVLVLRLLGDKSYREIADITGKKLGTVGWLVAEGVKALGARLEPLMRA